MKRRKLRKQPVLIFSALLAACLILIVWNVFFGHQRLKGGLDYLKSQDEQNLSEISSKVMANKSQKMVEAFHNGTRSVFSLFSDSVLIGDSRMYGFEAFDLVEPSRVLADAGYTINNVDDMVDEIRSLQPDVIYLSFGVNDMGLEIGSDLGENGYAQVYEQKVDELLSVSPNSKIVINSVIPVTDETVAKTERWAHDQEINDRLKELAQRRGWIYVDNYGISEDGHMADYADDGIHFQPSFYPVWAANMVEQVL